MQGWPGWLREFIMAKDDEDKTEGILKYLTWAQRRGKQTSLNSLSLPCSAHPSPPHHPTGVPRTRAPELPPPQPAGTPEPQQLPESSLRTRRFHSKSLTGKALPLPSPPALYFSVHLIAFLEIVLLFKKKKKP